MERNLAVDSAGLLWQFVGFLFQFIWLCLGTATVGGLLVG